MSQRQPATYPGLNLNDEQLFFVAYAQTWCAKANAGHRARQIKVDKHPPEPFRFDCNPDPPSHACFIPYLRQFLKFPNGVINNALT
jgi:hypothetical protein